MKHIVELTILLIIVVGTVIGQSRKTLAEQAAVQPPVIVPETIYLDSRDTLDDGAAGPISSARTLRQGLAYRLFVSGTMSAWPSSWWADLCLGTPEPEVETPSPDTINGPAGVDAAFIFAVPQLSVRCGALETVPYSNRAEGWGFQISLDGGLSWFWPEPDGLVYRSDHFYTYNIVGEGLPLQVRWLDDPAYDNYGVFNVHISAPLLPVEGYLPLVNR